MRQGSSEPLSIVHVLRTPVGGLFRHVCDLTTAQAAMGLKVGIFCDSLTGGANADKILERLKTSCALGIHRLPIGRLPGFGDWAAIRRLGQHLKSSPVNVVHGHGAKGGAYARLIAHSHGAKSFYTPHGGSLHYNPGSPVGFVFLTLERWLAKRTDGIIFESAFSQTIYQRKIGTPPCLVRVIHNGIGEDDFQPHLPKKNASDFVFIGELRKLKGVDVLLHALARLKTLGKPYNCTIAGDGPDAAYFQELSMQLGLNEQVSFVGFKAASQAFGDGRCLVIPSRAESFPYIVLEGAAAGLPIISTNVGGIPEIFGDQAELLIAPDSVDDLAESLEFAKETPDEMKRRANILRLRVKDLFSVSAMADHTVGFYQAANTDRP